MNGRVLQNALWYQNRVDRSDCGDVPSSTANNEIEGHNAAWSKAECLENFAPCDLAPLARSLPMTGCQVRTHQNITKRDREHTLATHPSHG
mmetsp:Transcript_23112/g.68173  ORF Transcript_23112/g.68173 Transcript_23112/m.68173 type:complete len:91 (+) Transcript_23112:2150-2422(+)